MKFTLVQKLRLAELSSKDATQLTDAEKSELADLKTKAKAAELDIDFIISNFAPDTKSADDGDEGEGEGGEKGKDGEDGKGLELGTDDLAKLITDAVAKAGVKGVDSTTIITAITEKLSAVPTIKQEELERIVAKHAADGKLDKDTLAAALREAMPKEKGVTREELKQVLEGLTSSIKSRSTEFPTGVTDMQFPIEHRSGNLSVAEKQLLNICLMHVSENVKEDMRAKGLSIPTGMNDGIAENVRAQAAKRGENAIKAFRNSKGNIKTLTTTGVGEGAELIPVDLSSSLLARFYLNSDLATEMMGSEVNMPTDPFKYPMTTTRPVFKVGSEAPAQDPTASNPGTKNVTLDAKKLIGMSDYSYEADEDAIIAVLETIMSGLGEGAASSFEGALIEGDDSTTHQHDDYHAITDHHTKLFKGFRKYAIAGSILKDLSTGNINATNIKAMRKLMKKYGIKPRDLLLLVGPQAYNDLVGLDETLTYEKVGSQAAARILTGEAASIFGIRIVVSGEIREDLNASGVYDGSTETKGSMILVHRPSWVVGVRRGFTLEVDVDKKKQINYVIASFRRAFTPIETPSTALPVVCLGYNNNVAA